MMEIGHESPVVWLPDQDQLETFYTLDDHCSVHYSKGSLFQRFSTPPVSVRFRDRVKVGVKT